MNSDHRRTNSKPPKRSLLARLWANLSHKKERAIHHTRLRFPHFIWLALVVGGVFDALFIPIRIPHDLASIVESGELVIATRNGSTTVYEGRDGLTGFEYELSHAFAKHLKVQPRYIYADSLEDVLELVETEQVNLAAASLAITELRETEVNFSSPYMQVKELFVCRRGGKRPKTLEELIDVNLVITEGSSYATHLRAAMKGVELPKLSFDEAGPEELMVQVWEKRIDCTIADTPMFDVTRRVYPGLVSPMVLTSKQPLAWALPVSADELEAEVDTWLASQKKKGEIKKLTFQYFDFFPKFNFTNMAQFRKDIKNVFPTYRSAIHAVAEENNLPWELVAAIGYQESHWHPDAKSPTGVRGFMMLTKATAKEMGVKDRLDAEQSIEGGARYFSKQLARIPEGVTGKDRYWFALAAYNMGMGHVYDARALAEKLGLNKNSWQDIRAVLPKLTQKKYFKDLRHGYARGHEAKRYVAQVRSFWRILDEH